MGMVLGAFSLVLYIFWALTVLTGVADEILTFLLRFNFIALQFAMYPVEPLFLVAGAATSFATGYIVGTVLAYIWNLSYSYF
ncbi:MAG: hypothetical protein MUP63_02215 [Candidatus Nanohaloarchaeota archaeon QJJ-7]|nr:hypothetical protein [Candidatus Nanohaloarchaeota archaeon QJJ-7]